MYACLAVTCHLHFWQNDRDFLHATVVTRGWNGYQNKSQHRKSTVEKKILLPFQQGFEPATFQSWVRRSNHWAIPAPNGGETKDYHTYHLLAQSGMRWQEQDKGEKCYHWASDFRVSLTLCLICGQSTQLLFVHMPVHMIPVAWSIYDQFYPNRENGPLCWMYASQTERHFISAATPHPTLSLCQLHTWI